MSEALGNWDADMKDMSTNVIGAPKSDSILDVISSGHYLCMG